SCFHHTSTPPIYTLSLHDALPICDNSLPGGHLSFRMLILDLVLAAAFLRFFPEFAELLRQLLHRHGRLELAEEASRIKARKTNSDRKSTRLNSSHLVISYAVFCLK